MRIHYKLTNEATTTNTNTPKYGGRYSGCPSCRGARRSAPGRTRQGANRSPSGRFHPIARNSVRRRPFPRRAAKTEGPNGGATGTGEPLHNCFTTAPTCTASRGSLLTDLYPWQLEEGCQLWGLLPRKYKTYPDILEEAGYFVGLTNKAWGPRSIEASGGVRNPAGPSFDERRCTPLTSCMNSNDYAANFRDSLERKPDDQPFCFWYGSKEPHRTYEKGSALRHGKRLKDLDVPANMHDREEVRSDMLDYALQV